MTRKSYREQKPTKEPMSITSNTIQPTEPRPKMPWALLAYHLIFFVLLFINFPYGKFFTGWDNLHPEFDFLSNFRRSIFASWQENYGLGTLGGHGFAAVLPHNIITYLTSFVMPIEMIRPFFTFLTYYLGGFGIYLLILALIRRIKIVSNMSDHLLEFIALFSALFYMLNLGTIQMFNVQLETFIANYAALPWLFYMVLRIIEKPTKKNFILFFIVNFFATLQGFIPSLFVAYFGALVIFLSVYVVSDKFSSKTIKKSVLLLASTLLINSYWLFPLTYYATNMKDVYPNSNINLKSTIEFIERNKKYGDIKNVPLIKGFIFDTTESPDSNQHIYAPWVKHQQGFVIPTLGYIFFAIIAYGVIKTLLSKNDWRLKAFTGVFFIYFVGMTTNLPPFSLITYIMQNYVPIFKDAFRTPFTKFAFGVAFSYSVFLGIGVVNIVDVLKNKIGIKRVKPVLATFGIALFLYSLPSFQGNLLASKLKLVYPEMYFKVFSYMQLQEPTGKIADLPQDMHNGWYSYSWGYSGSGFLWFGLPQPVVSRTFDVWSNNNENYYWELTQALREENFDKVDRVFSKYDVKWILYDKNLIPAGAKGFNHLEKYLEYLKSSPNYKLVGEYKDESTAPVYLFKNLAPLSTNNIKLIEERLPNIYPKYDWNDDDLAFRQIGQYVTDPKSKPDLIYPFRSVFTKRNSYEKEFKLDVNDEEIIIGNQLPELSGKYTLSLSDFYNSLSYIPISIAFSESKEVKEVILGYNLPRIFVDGKSISDYNITEEIGTIPSITSNIKVYINGILVDKKNSDESYASIFYPNINNSVLITDENDNQLVLWNDSGNLKKIINSQGYITLQGGSPSLMEVRMKKVEQSEISFDSTGILEKAESKPCFNLLNGQMKTENKKNEFGSYREMTVQDNRQCLVMFTNIHNRYSYLLKVDSANIEGQPLEMFVAGQRGNQILNVFLERNKSINSEYFVIPPAFQYEYGYYLTFMNVSHNDLPSINDLQKVTIWPIEKDAINNIYLKAENAIFQSPDTTNTMKVLHPNETSYEIYMDKAIPSGSIINLTQSYSNGWVAFANNKLLDHILVDNWSNGWKTSEDLPQGSKVKILFWPQYLEFFGFILLAIYLTYILSVKEHVRE